MKKFFALCFTAVIMYMMCISAALASIPQSSLRYNKKDVFWQGDENTVGLKNMRTHNPNRKNIPDEEADPYQDWYGVNCFYFVDRVLSDEQRGTISGGFVKNGAYLNGYEDHLINNDCGGQYLNSTNHRGPTSRDVKNVFVNAQSGDVAQMYWYGIQHTALINGIDSNGVEFFESHHDNDQTKRVITSDYYTWQGLADQYSYDKTGEYGGISLYRFSGSATPTPTPLPEGSVKIDAENFPDEYFRNYVLENCDPNKDGILSAEEAASVTYYIDVDSRGITNLKGIEYFTALTELHCKDNQLTALDVSKNTALIHLFCDNNQLTALDLSKNTALMILSCYENQLTTLDLSNNTTLTELICNHNKLTALDLSKNVALTWLLCYENQLSILNMSSNIALTHLDCANNQLTTLNVSNNTVLTYLDCDNNQLTVLDVSNNIALEVLNCAYNKLTTLDVSNCQNLSDEHIRYDSGLKILRNKPRLVSSLVDITTNTPVSVFSLRSNVLDATAQLIEAVVKSGIITYTGTKETLNKVARGLQIISSIYSGNFLTRFFTDKVIPAILKSSGGDDTEKFQLSESLSLNVTPAVFKTSEGTVKITLASSRDLSHDVYCTIVSDDSGRFFKVPASDSSRRLFTAEFNAGEFFASMDAGIIELMCVSCISDDEGICGMLMSNTASVDWLMNDTTPPEILTETLTNAITNQVYSLQLTASGGTPITWTHRGNFPKGLTLSESGLISGTPTKAGKYTFTVTASNSYGESSKKFTLQVLDPVSITTASLRAGTIGKSYNVTMKAKGSKVITWSAEGLPNGLTINAKGEISGKPTAYGDFSVKITATNPAGSVTKSLQLTVKAIEPKLAGSLARATLNEAYSSGLKVTGSTPIIWTLTGNLPEGLTFDTSTGIISGTPTSYAKSGYKITITASNDAGKKSKKITLKVNAKAPRITTSKLPEATVNQSYSFALTATGSTPITFTADNLPEGLTLSDGVISGKPTEAAKSFRIVIYAENPVKTVKKSFTLKINDDDSNTQFPAVKFSDVTPNVMLTDDILPENISGGYLFALGEVSCDESGMYDFELEFPDYVNEGSELVYAANSESPSDDDDIAEFFDDTGEEITAVPASRKIIISVWLNEEVTYKPVVIVKK